MTRHTPQELFDRLRTLAIETRTHEHEAVFTVAESAHLKMGMPGAHSKNLFLKDRKGRLFLVVAEHGTAIDLKRLHEPLGATGRLSFGSPDLLRERLGVEPGSVTPFAVVNDPDTQVSVILDADLMRRDLLNFHPLRNTMTTAIAAQDLLRFLRATGHEPRIVQLPAPPDTLRPAEV